MEVFNCVYDRTQIADKNLLGNKGQMLFEMTQLGLNVPKFFIITTNVFKSWQFNRLEYNELEELIRGQVNDFNTNDFVSCRSSAPVSMPGILSTFLNINVFDIDSIANNTIEIFSSWNSQLAKEYKKQNSISDDLGVAVIIQKMVDGTNPVELSGTGVVCSVNPSNGREDFFGDFLPFQQGDKLMSGEKTPFDIKVLNEKNKSIYEEISGVSKKLDKHFGVPQEIEFTIEKNIVYYLQTRNLKVITDNIESTEPMSASSVLIGAGLPASNGIVTGKIVFQPIEVGQFIENGEKVILVRQFTATSDYFGMMHADGFLTSTGGKTSHAAIIARDLKKPCIVGAKILIDYENEKVKIGNYELRKGDIITIDGKSGKIYSDGGSIV